MKHILDKLSNKKEDAPDDHAEAKMQVLQELRDMAMGMMGDRLRDKMPHEMHGVEVMAPDQEGLKKGLDMAQKVLPDEEAAEEKIHPGIHEAIAGLQKSGNGQPDRSHALSPDADLSEERLENPGEDHDDMDDDELDAMISELQAKKAARDPRFQK